jgi:arylsulfatase A-like enzyme
LQECLKAQGYYTALIGAGHRRDVHYRWPGERQNVDYFFDGALSTDWGPFDDRLLLEGIEQMPLQQEAPLFLYLHLMSAHFLSPVQPQFSQKPPATRMFSSDFTLENIGSEEVESSYDNGAQQADFYLGKAIALLKQKGWLDGAVMIILADHGEMLGEHEFFGHKTELHQPLLDIPFLIFDDPAIAYRNLDHASLIDVAPTLLERVGLTIPAIWEGRSLLSQPPAPYTFHQTEEARPDFAVIAYADTARVKYLLRQPPGQPIQEYLFNLTRDPAEAHNLLRHPAYRGYLDTLRTLAARKFSQFPLQD